MLENPFLNIKKAPKTIRVVALNGAEVKVRPLTIGEVNEITAKAIKSIDANGKPEMDLKAAALIKVEKLSRMLVEPKMSVEELLNLDAYAALAIDEILEKASDKKLGN